MSSRSEPVTVIPSPALSSQTRPDGVPLTYVRGVPAVGKTMTRKQAQPLLDAGLVVIKPAAGGPVSAGKTYLVGEKGPETFTPAAGGVVIPINTPEPKAGKE